KILDARREPRNRRAVGNQRADVVQCGPGGGRLAFERVGLGELGLCRGDLRLDLLDRGAGFFLLLGQRPEQHGKINVEQGGEHDAAEAGRRFSATFRGSSPADTPLIVIWHLFVSVVLPSADLPSRPLPAGAAARAFSALTSPPRFVICTSRGTASNTCSSAAAQ